MSVQPQINFSEWSRVTGNLRAGEQRAFLDVLHLAADGQITLVHGTDNFGGGACLVNACRQMLASTQNENISPSQAYGDVVSEFDRINTILEDRGINTERYFVSEIAASALIKNFGDIKPLVIPLAGPEDATKPYREKSDEEFAAWLGNISSNPVCDVVDIAGSNVATPAEQADFEENCEWITPLSETREFL